MKVGVILSGGGIRGVAHIGFLKALEEMGIVPDCYAGASAGAIVSALTSAGYTPDEILEIAKDNQIFSLAKLQWPQLGLGTLDKIPKILSDYIAEDSFEFLSKPIAVSMANMTLGKSEIRTKGALFKVIQASCSIPVLFKPVEIDDHFYADGGILNNFPAIAFRDECDILLGMDLVSGDPVEKEDISSIFRYAVRTFELAISGNSKHGRSLCDLTVVPKRAADQPILFTKNVKNLYDSGYDSTMKRSEEIKKLLNE